MPRDVSRKDKRGWRLRLADIIGAVRKILEFTTGKTFDEFAGNTQAIDAVLHNFVVLGEAARHVPIEVEATRPDVPWDEMRVMRNVTVHVYHGIVLPRVWATIRDDLPPLLPVLEAMLAEIDRTEDEGERTMLTYKAMYKFLDGAVHGEVLDFPGAITAGPDLAEARRLLESALVDMAETNLLHGETLPTPDPSQTDPESDIEEPISLPARS